METVSMHDWAANNIEYLPSYIFRVAYKFLFDFHLHEWS